MKENDLKKELTKMGIEIVKGNYVRKNDIMKVLAKTKPKAKAVLDTNTMKQGIQILKKNKRFNELKKQYETLKNELMGSSSLSPEEASSVINYAIHASADQSTNKKLTESIEHLAGDVISLGYDEQTEKELLTILERLYDSTKAGITADMSWDQIIEQNRAKKLKQKSDMQTRNKKVIEDVKKGTKRKADEPSPAKEKVKEKVAKKIKSLDNVITVDFKKGKNPQSKEKQEGEDRMQRIRESLKVIEEMMRKSRSGQ